MPNSFDYRGGTISYAISPIKSTKSAVPLVLLHGLGASAAQWSFALGDLCADRPVILIDLPGHGHSPMTKTATNGSFADFRDLVTELVTSLGTRQVDIGGISMGAGVAMAVAMAAPHMVRSILVVRPAWLNAPNPDNLAIIARIGGWLTKGGVSGALEALENDPEYAFIAEETPLAAASLVQAITRPNAERYSPVLSAMVSDAPFKRLADLRNLNKPIMVATCNADALHPVSAARIIANSVPCSTFEMLPPRYLEPVAHEAALIAAIRNFLTELSDHTNSKSTA